MYGYENQVFTFTVHKTTVLNKISILQLAHKESTNRDTVSQKPATQAAPGSLCVHWRTRYLCVHWMCVHSAGPPAWGTQDRCPCGQSRGAGGQGGRLAGGLGGRQAC